MLNTPVKRIFLLVAIIGCGLFIYGTQNWFRNWQHHLILRTKFIPDYPIRSDNKMGLVQIHRSCEWTDKNPGGDLYDPKGDLVEIDALLSVSEDCVRKYLNPNKTTINLIDFWRFSIPRYRNVLYDDYLAKRFWFSPDNIESGEQLYRGWVSAEAMKVGLSDIISKNIADHCVMSSPRWCVTSQKYTYIHAWEIIRSDLSMITGMVLFAVGLSGSFFYSPLSALWRITGGRILKWILTGK